MRSDDHAEPAATVVRLVYVLHFDRPINDGGAQHYVGITGDLPRRLYEHSRGSKHASVVTWAAIRQHIGFTVVLTVFPATYKDERRIKNLGFRKVCPACGADPETVLAKAGITGTITRFPHVETAEAPTRSGRQPGTHSEPD